MRSRHTRGRSSSKAVKAGKWGTQEGRKAEQGDKRSPEAGEGGHPDISLGESRWRDCRIC